MIGIKTQALARLKAVAAPGAIRLENGMATASIYTLSVETKQSTWELAFRPDPEVKDAMALLRGKKVVISCRDKT